MVKQKQIIFSGRLDYFEVKPIIVLARNNTGSALFLILILQQFFSLATLARSG